MADDSTNYAAILGAAIQVAGPLIGQQLAKMDQEKVLQLLRDSRDATGRIQLPALQKLVAEQQGDAALSGIQEDSRYRAQQDAADSQLDNVISSGGLTLSDKAALNEILGRTQRSEAAGRNAIAQDLQRRGALDSGAQLGLSLANQQNAANAAAQAGENTAAQAQQRAYNAILQRSQFASQGLDRDWRQKSEAARAQDAINQGNTNIRNVTNRYNAGLPQQGYENELRRQNEMNSLDRALAGYHQGQADRTVNTAVGASQGAAQGVAAAGLSDDTSDAASERRMYEKLKAKYGGRA